MNKHSAKDKEHLDQLHLFVMPGACNKKGI